MITISQLLVKAPSKRLFFHRGHLAEHPGERRNCLASELHELLFTALAFEENRKDYGLELAEAQRALPDKVIFRNVDATRLERASHDDVMREVSRQVSVAGPEKFILLVGSLFTPSTSLGWVRFFCESTQRL